MPNLNKVMLMGNLTRDPELRYLPSNMPVVTLGLAINRRWRNQQGEQQEETTFIDCESFGRQAEVINQYLRKGRPIFIEGRLRLDQWQDKDGNNRSKLKVVVESFQFVDSRGDEGGGGSGGGGGYGRGQGQGSYNQGGGAGGYGQQGGYGNQGGYGRQAPPAGGPGGPGGAGGPGGGAGGSEPHQAVEEDDIPF